MKKLLLRLADRLTSESPYLFERALADALIGDKKLLASVSRAVAKALDNEADKIKPNVISFDEDDI